MHEPSVQISEQPVFSLGLAGFDAAGRAAIEAALARSPAMPQWRIAPFGDADAWFANGPRCRASGDHLRVAPGVPTELSVSLDVSSLDRPLAFATPLAPEIQARYRFDAGSTGAIQGVLLQFDACLRLARAEFALGRQVVELGARLRHRIFHVSLRNRLLAVLDFRRGIAGLSPQLQPGDLRDAEWVARPEGAGAIPEHFVTRSTAQLAWTYAQRSPNDLLPSRYREQTIHYRGAPRVPLHLLRDSQLLLLKELVGRSASLAELGQRTSLAAARIERDLTCLYFASAITTTATKAARSRVVDAEDSGSSLAQSGLPLAEAPRRPPIDPTVPAMLKASSSRLPA